jgi:hypothetical protein
MSNHTSLRFSEIINGIQAVQDELDPEKDVLDMIHPVSLEEYRWYRARLIEAFQAGEFEAFVLDLERLGCEFDDSDLERGDLHGGVWGITTEIYPPGRTSMTKIIDFDARRRWCQTILDAIDDIANSPY